MLLIYCTIIQLYLLILTWSIQISEKPLHAPRQWRSQPKIFGGTKKNWWGQNFVL